MKLILLASLLSLALGHPTSSIGPVTLNYHETIGIEQASLIKAAEESRDFDGSRIVGGANAFLGQFPFMGGLIIDLTIGRQSVCGSSLISNTRLVTAAHCWFDGQHQAIQFTVVLGSVILFTGGTRVVTRNVITHPNWNPANLNNDVAVIVINPVNYDNNIRNIALASGSSTFADFLGTVAGFGIQRDGSSVTTNQQLHHVQVEVVTNEQCARTYFNSIIASTICTSGLFGRSPCLGDSGGPLEMNVNGVRTLIGIYSFGHISGCNNGWPAGYARVTAFNSWIRSLM